jgi:hypothetical protein
MINSSSAKINVNLLTYSASSAHYALRLGCKTLYRGIIAINSEILTKHVNTLRGQAVEYFSVKRRGAKRDQ